MIRLEKLKTNMAHPVNHFSLHHYLKQKRTKKNIDKMAYIIGIGGNVAVIPQITRAWESKAPGMAITTWLLFIVFGLIWLVYAILHKQKPLIVAQIVGICCSLLVVIGWAVNNLVF